MESNCHLRHKGLSAEIFFSISDSQFRLEYLKKENRYWIEKIKKKEKKLRSRILKGLQDKKKRRKEKK